MISCPIVNLFLLPININFSSTPRAPRASRQVIDSKVVEEVDQVTSVRRNLS